jgi:hypothetical protein
MPKADAVPAAVDALAEIQFGSEHRLANPQCQHERLGVALGEENASGRGHLHGRHPPRSARQDAGCGPRLTEVHNSASGLRSTAVCKA